MAEEIKKGVGWGVCCGRCQFVPFSGQFNCCNRPLSIYQNSA